MHRVRRRGLYAVAQALLFENDDKSFPPKYPRCVPCPAPSQAHLKAGQGHKSISLVFLFSLQTHTLKRGVCGLAKWRGKVSSFTGFLKPIICFKGERK